MILLDSYGWIEYFADGPLAERYASYAEQVSADTTVLPAIVYATAKREAATLVTSDEHFRNFVDVAFIGAE